MLDLFKTRIKTVFPELRERTFLLASSGGVDSMVLTHLCLQCGLIFEVAHCNFQLRGAASDDDEEFVRSYAKENTLVLHVTRFETETYVEKQKVSIEMAARELRYRWFDEIMKERGISTLVTAHHADDSLETFLINLSRGTGINGLTGIPEKTDHVSRPLLPFSRAEILAYAENNGIQWREDHTNAETVFLRNKVRHDIVPKLKELHPTFLDNFRKTQNHLSDSAIILDNHVRTLQSRVFEKENGVIRIPIAEMERLHPLKAYLHALFNAYGFTAWEDIQELLSAMSGKQVLSKTHRLVKDRDYLLLEERRLAAESQYTIAREQMVLEKPVQLQLEDVDAMDDTTENILYADKTALKYPLVVRKWKKGDYFYPFGMKGKKKLSKYFKDEKIDVISKEKQWLLCSGDDIVWIIGRRSDNRFKVTKNSKNIVKIKYIK